MAELMSLLLHMVLISLTSFVGSAQALFYDVGVEQFGWINGTDYANYLGFGFATPGPAVFSLATFMGYRLAGWPGAVLGTLGIYLPSIMLAVFVGKYLKKWVQHERVRYFVQTVGLAAAGVLIFIGLNIIVSNPLSPLYLIIAGVSAVATGSKRVNPLLIIVAGLLAGLFLA